MLRHLLRHYRPVLALSAIFCLVGSVLVPVVARADQAPAPDDAVQRAWARAQEIGVYDFSTEIVQTTYPAPTIAGAGASASVETINLEGETNVPGRALHLTLYSGGNLLTGRDGFEVQVNGDDAQGRTLDGEWQPVPDFSGAFAPGSDLLAYLAGADNVRALPADGALARYGFDVDGPAFARYVRDQMEGYFLRAGKLPVGMSLETSNVYRGVTGEGELWLDAAGLPLRLQVTLIYPREGNGERVTAELTTDFSGFPESASTTTSGAAALLARLPLPRTPRAWSEASLQMGFSLGCFGLFVTLVTNHRSRRLYAALVLVIIASMIGAPLLTGVKAAAFSEEQAARQAELDAQQQAQEAASQAQVEMQGANWDAHLDPSAVEAAVPPAGVAGAALQAAPQTTIQSPVPSSPYRLTATGSGDTGCTGEEQTSDTDSDGLTDCDERTLWLTESGTNCVDPDVPPAEGRDACLAAAADSDGDGLLDGWEALRLGTEPRKQSGYDSDGDGIGDNLEVAGFEVAGQRWYSNPNDPDSDDDGLPDGTECPERKNGDGTTISATTPCRDTDGDGVPDLFDRDSDDDGVPDRIDISPLTVYGSAAPFTRDQPFELVVDNLQEKAGAPGEYYPVTVDLQLRPTNPQHLTYVMNVLDWPSGDEEGQIQRLGGNDSTFGTSMTAAERDAMPQANNGDIRLIPMLEIELSGGDIPLPTTTPQTSVSWEGDITGTVGLRQSGSDIAFDFSDWTGRTDYLYFAIYEGTCRDIMDEAVPRFSVNPTATSYTWHNRDLTELADGEHVIVVDNGDFGSPLASCAVMRDLPNGSYTDLMFDSEPLKPYGMSVRDADSTGTVLAYLPLNVLPDDSGGGRSAFSAHVPYMPIAGNLGDTAQRFRVVWLVQILNDWCTAPPDGLSAEALDAWCEDGANWSLDNVQIIHAYAESWTLTGLDVREDHGLNASIVWEDPSAETPEERQFDDWLWLLSSNLNEAFISGRDENHNDVRDLGLATTAAGLTIAETTLSERFDSPLDSAITITDRMGIPLTATLHVRDFVYATQDEIARVMMTETTSVLDDAFGSYTDATPTLLIAREELARSAGPAAPGTMTLSGRTAAADLSGQKIQVLASMSWAPYRYRDGAWQSYPLEEYWDLLGARLRATLPQNPNLSEEDNADILEGEILVARAYYLSMNQGRVGLVQEDDLPVYQYDARQTDTSLAMNAAGIVKQIRSASKGVFSVVKMIAEAAQKAWPGIQFEASVARGIAAWLEPSPAEKVFRAIGRGILGAVKENLASLRNLMNKLCSKLYGTSPGAARVIGVSVALALAAVAAVTVIVVGFVYGDTKLMISACVSVVMAVVQVSLAIKAIYNAATNAIKAASKAASVCAVVGVIVGIVLAFVGMLVTMIVGKMAPGSLGANAAFAEAVAYTVVAVIMFAIASIPIVGQIIAAIIAAIDAVIAGICALVSVGVGEDVSQRAGGWACKGISGFVAALINQLIYNATFLIDMADEERLQFGPFDYELVSPDKGLAVGSAVRYISELTSTIKLVPVIPPTEEMKEGWKDGSMLIPVNWMSLSYAWQFSDKNLKSSTFEYSWHTDDGDIHESLDDGTMRDLWLPGEETHTYYITPTVVSEGISLTTAGINYRPTLYLSEGYVVPVQECFVVPNVINPMCAATPYLPYLCLVPVCHIRYEKGTNAMDLSQRFILDVFPETLDDFYAPVSKDGGYSLAWGQDATITSTALSGAALTFGRQKDFDGDGLRNSYDGGADPDDRLWDTDGDGLSDLYESQHGSDATRYDTDADGLSDADELRFDTDARRPDTDGDGLTDAEEIAGWDIVYGLSSDGTPLRTGVRSDPLSPDADNDGLTDFQEKTYGLNPDCKSDPTVIVVQPGIDEAASPRLLLRLDDEPDPDATGYVDGSGHGKTALCAAASADCPYSVTGRYAYALQFDGTQALEVAHSEVNALQRSFTVAAWIHPQATGGSQTIVATARTETVNGYALRLVDGALHFTAYGARDYTLATPLVQAGVWTHVAAVVGTDGAVTFYTGGTNRGSFPGSGALTDTDDQLLVGAATRGGSSVLVDGFAGAMDEIAVFDRALTGAEVRDLRDARYDPSDRYLRPGASLRYETGIENKLLDRYAQGLSFLAPDVPGRLTETLDPQTFVLEPQDAAVQAGTVQLNPLAATGGFTLTQMAQALVTDWREQSDFAELWLPLNDPAEATTFEDYSGNVPPRDGTCNGTTCPAIQQPGYFDYALRFDGSQLVTLADATKLGLQDTSFSVSAWVKGSDLSGSGAAYDRSIMGTANEGANATLALVLRDREPYMGFGSNDLDSNVKLDVNVWYHLVFRYDKERQEQAIYINGDLRASRTGAVPFEGTGTVTLGQSRGGYGFKGWIDDVRIYRRALSLEEVQALYNKPVLRLSFEETPRTITTYADASGFENTGTCSGTCPGAASGVYGQRAARFEGDDYVTLNAGPSLNLSDGQFTISAWVKPATSGNSDRDGHVQGILGAYRGSMDPATETTGAATSYPTLFYEDGKLRFGYGTGSTWISRITAQAVLASGAWHHVVLSFGPATRADGTFDQYRARLYVNNELKADWGMGTVAPYGLPGNTLSIGRVSNRANVYLDHFDVTTQADESSHCEVYLKWNGSKICSGTDIPGPDCIWGGLDEGSTVDLQWGPTLLSENAKLEIWEADDGFEAGHNYGDDPLCPVGMTDCTGYGHVFSTSDPSVTSLVLDYQGDNKSTNDGLNGEDRTRINLTLGNGDNWAFRNPSIPFSGSMDEVTIYRRAFSADDVQELYLSASTAMRLRLDDPPGSETFEDSVDVSRRNNAYCAGATCPTAGIAGRDNQAADFDGADDALQTALTLDESNSGPGATLMAWVRPEGSTSGAQHVLSTAGSAYSYGWSLVRMGSTWYVTNGHELLNSGAAVDVGVWQHLAITFVPGTGITVYKNGSRVTSMPLAITYPATVGTLTVGARSDGTGPFRGAVDDVRVYSRALDGEDIATIRSFAPVLQLHLDEDQPTGTFADVGGGSSGTCSGDACPQVDTDGQVGRAVAFNTVVDGEPDVISVPDAATFDLPQFTVSTWVMPTDLVDHQQTLVDKDSNYTLLIPAGGMTATVRFVSGTQSYQLQSQSPLIQNMWNHVAGTCDGQTLRIYVNGYEQNQMVVSGAPTTNSNALRLGGASASTAFRGRLDEVTVYNHALSSFEVRDLFLYQGKLVEAQGETWLTIDNDAPTSALRSYNADFPYVSRQGMALQVNAFDPTSDISLVELGVDDTYISAVPCQDATTRSAWCPYFEPDAEGLVTLRTRATDLVGNRETPSEVYSYYVDGTAPAITAGWGAETLVNATPHTTLRNTWVVALNGTVADPPLPGSIAGSGLLTGSLKITLLTPAGAPLGLGNQVAQVTGNTWTLDYVVHGARPTGLFTVQAEATDRVGNTSARTLAALHVDATASGADLDVAGLPATYITDTTPIEGVVSELPLVRGTSLVLHFEEAAGSTIFRDASTAVNQVACDDAASCPTAGVTGQYGLALSLDGSASYLRVPHSAINETVQAFSIAAWIYPSDLTGVRQIVATAQVASGDDGFGFGLTGSGLQFEAFGGTTATVPDVGLQVGQWAHVAVVVEGATLTFYVNGVAQDTITLAQSPAADLDDDLIVGAAQTGSGDVEHFAGLLDELVITRRALSVDEVRALAQTEVAGVAEVDVALRSTLPGSPYYNAVPLPGLALHLPLNDQPDAEGGLRFLDLSPAQLTGSCSGDVCPEPGLVGHDGSAAGFDGQQDAIDLADFGSFITTTVAAWVAPAGGEGTILGYKADSTAPDGGCGIVLALGTTDTGAAVPTASVKVDGTWVTAEQSVAVPQDVWVQLAASYDGEALRLYRDGEEVAETAAAGEMTQCSAPSAVGSRPDGTAFFAGRIDDVQVYDRALGSDEIATLYRGIAPVLALAFDQEWLTGEAATPMRVADASAWAQQATLYTGNGDATNKTMPGQVGPYALNLDGINDYVAVERQSALDLSHGQYTEAAWVFTPDDTDVHPIFGSGAYVDTADSYPFLHVFNSTRLSAGFGDGSTLLSADTGNVLTAGSWNHVATTFDGDTLTFYVNGVAVETSTALGGHTPAATSQFDVGRGGSAAALPGCGDLAELAVTPGAWVRELRVKLDGRTVHDVLWPTLGVASVIPSPGTFCGSLQAEVETWSDVLWSWVSLGTTTLTPDVGRHSQALNSDGISATLVWTANAAPDSLSTWGGGIDDVRIFPRALSAGEIAALAWNGWQVAALASGDAGPSLTGWSSQIGAGLEGSYSLDLRGRDTAGLVDASGVSQRLWTGEIDTLAPRVLITRTNAEDGYRYVTVAEDYNLIEQGFSSPCGAGIVSSEETFLSAWYQSLSASSGVGRNRITRLSADCTIDAQGLFPVGAWTELPLVDDRFVLRGSTAFVPAGALWAVDVANPALPRYLSVSDLGGDGRGVAVSGDQAYVADGVLGLSVVDLNQSAATPVRADTPGTALDVALLSTYAYVADGAGGLRVVDLTDPAHPALAGSLAMPGQALGIAISGSMSARTLSTAQPAVPLTGAQPPSSEASSPEILPTTASLPNGEPVPSGVPLPSGVKVLPSKMPVAPAGTLTSAFEPASIEALYTEPLSKITGPGGTAYNSFGTSVDIEGDTMVVGAADRNEVHILRRNVGGADAWGAVRTLTAPASPSVSNFGTAVAVSGDTVVVGAIASSMRYAYVFIYSRNQGGADHWGLVRTHSFLPAIVYDTITVKLAIDGNTAVAGIYAYEHISGALSSAMIVLERNAGGADVWDATAGVWPSDAQGPPTVAISGDVIAMGMERGYSWPVYQVDIYYRNQDGVDAWGLVTELKSTTGGTGFGSAIGLSGDTMVVDNSITGGPAAIHARNQGGADQWGQVTQLAVSGDRVAIDGDRALVADSGSSVIYLFERNEGGLNAWGQARILTPSDGATGTRMGWALAYDGSTVAAGAPYGNAVYLFTQQGTHWDQRVTLAASDAVGGDEYGASVSIAGDSLAVGAPMGDDPYTDAGVVYVLGRNQGGADAWGEVARVSLPPAEAGADGQLGYAVALDGNALVAGMPGWDTPGGADWAGAAYLFERHQGGVDAWGQVARLNPGTVGYWDAFGSVVDIDGGVVVVGTARRNQLYVFTRNHGGSDAWGLAAATALSHRSNVVAVSGDTAVTGAGAFDDLSPNPGIVTVVRRNVGGADAWGTVRELSVTGDASFGMALAIEGDILAVGAPRDTTRGSDAGAVYIFARNEGGADAWGQVAKIYGSDIAAGVRFGGGLALDEDILLVRSNSALYVFERNQGGADAWGQVQSFAVSGTALSLDHDLMVVGDAAASGSTGQVLLYRNLWIEATADTYSVNEDETLSVSAPGVLSNDSLGDTATLPSGTLLVSNAAHGVLNLAANGGFSYTPAPNYNGSDSFSYRATEGTAQSDVVAVTLTITDVNDLPVANADSYTATEDTTLTVNATNGVLANDGDADGDAITAVQDTDPAHGSVTLNANGSFMYMPDADYAGPDSFTYHATDGTDDSASATVSITVDNVNDPPVAADDAYTTPEDTTLQVAAPGVLGNDGDVDAGTTLTAVRDSDPVTGTLALAANGSFTYIPPLNYSGVVSFTYHAYDGSAGSNVATAVITVTAVDDAPVVASDVYTTNLDTPLLVAAPGLLSNDYDVEGASLTAQEATGPAHGAVAVHIDGGFIYTPTTGYTGADGFTYRASDGTLSSVGAASLWINAPPSAQDISVFTLEDTPITVTVVPAYVSDPEGDPLAIISVGTPSSGTAVISGTTGVRFTPTLNYSGTVTFPYTIADPGGLTATARITVTVGGVNDAPVAVDDTAVTNEDASVVVRVLDNDYDPDGQSPSLVRVGTPSLGSARITGPTVTYTPAADLNGTDTFTYTITDGALADTARVTITVNAVNDAPTLAPIPDLALEPNAGEQTLPLMDVGPGAPNEDQVVSINASSSNHGLIADPVVDYVASEEIWTLSLTPVSGQTGSATVTVTATDGLSDTVRLFKVTVWPIVGPFAYIASGEAGLLVVDLSRPADPRQVGIFDTSGEVRDVVLAGDRAYLADGPGGLVIADLSSPTLPRELATLPTPGFASGVAVSGTHAFIADGYAGVTMIDVGDPGAPTVMSTSDTPGYASKIELSGRYVYVSDSSGGLRIFDTAAPLGQATACDRAGNCTTATAVVLTTMDAAAVMAEPTTGVSFLNVPPVLDSRDPITLTGRAFNDLSTLRALTVTVDGTPIYTPTWASGTVSRTTWRTAWSPAGLTDGSHTLDAELEAWSGGTVTESLDIVLDTVAPVLSVATDVVTGTAYHAPDGFDLAGLVSDAGGVYGVRVACDGSESEAELIPSAVPGTSRWHAIWSCGPGALPDGDTYTVTAQARDVAGRTTTVTQTVMVDVVAPEPVTLTLGYAGATLPEGATVRDPAPMLTLTWTSPHDGSGPVTTEPGWTAVATATQVIARGDTYIGGDGVKVSGLLTQRDIYGQATVQRVGPVYLDTPQTPDYVPIVDPASGSTDGIYDGWLASGCSLIGVDRRIANNTSTLAALNAEQRLYATWNTEALRLAWTGANWDIDGDLFVYLDTGPGGSTTAFSPYPATMTSTVIYMPGVTPATVAAPPPEAMAADALIWVRDASTALLLRWRGDHWDFETALPKTAYHYDAGRNGGQTDLYLPFDLLELTPGDSLDLVALASDEGEMRLWAVMPNANPVNSNRVVETATFADDNHTFALSRRYHWDGLGAGVCPNGQDGSTSVRYADTDLTFTLSAAPHGVAYSQLNDNLFWLWDVLESDKPSDVSRLFSFMSTDAPYVGARQPITYTLTVRNRGTDVAGGVTANVETYYALHLASGGTTAALALGDVAPGASTSVTFVGVVDLVASSLPWAGVGVALYDDDHQPPEAPLDRLWIDHRVDREAPEFVGIQTPGYVLRAGLNTLRGYAYDVTAVPALRLDVIGRGPVLCTDATPWDGQWACVLNASGLTDGTTLTVRAAATDAFGQVSLPSAARALVVDTQPPTLALDTAPGLVQPGSLVRSGSARLAGSVHDTYGLGTVEVCVDGSCVSPDLTLTAADSVRSFVDQPVAPLAIDSGTACGGSELVRTFTVTDSFTLGTVQVGLIAAHAHRDDLQVDLRSPAGTRVRLVTDDGDPGTHGTNYAVLLDDAAPTPYSASQNDDVAGATLVALDRTARPADPLSAFSGEDAAGTWTLTLCDLDPAAHDGAYYASRLLLAPEPARLTPRSGTWAFAIDTPEPLDSVTREVAVYATDLAGNRTASPLTFEFTVDNVAPVVTPTLLTESSALTASIPVLVGTVSDGSVPAGASPADAGVEVSVLVQAPARTYRAATTQVGDTWAFALQPGAAGLYALFVSATDAAGNVVTRGPYTVMIREPFRVHMPIIGRAMVSAPDLFVTDLRATPWSIQLTIENRGNATADEAFWVDVYIDPDPEPYKVNQIWQDLSRQGLVWGVTRPLAPGEVLTLTLGDTYYMRTYSSVAWPLPAGLPVFAQVDSANALTTYGAVLEDHEILDLGYNNIAQTTVSATVGLTTWPDSEGGSPFLLPDVGQLPRRR